MKSLTRARCATCSWPLSTHPHGTPCVVSSAEIVAGTMADGKVTPAARDVLAERRRQVTAEGWTPEHDNEHDDGSLAQAAACYALGRQFVRAPFSAAVGRLWPWEDAAWKPRDPRSNLVRAGALILAEIERLDRASAATAAASSSDQAAAPAPAKTCSYPECNCPFDAPGDPNWCARGLPRKPRLAPAEKHT